MPTTAKEDIRAGQRVIITDDNDALAFATEDYGIGQGRIFGTVEGRYDKQRYRVRADNGEEFLLWRNDFEPINEKDDSVFLLFWASVIAILVLIAVGIFGAVQP